MFVMWGRGEREKYLCFILAGVTEIEFMKEGVVS